MRTLHLGLALAMGVAIFATASAAQHDSSASAYKILKTAKVGGEGGFDYVYADSAGRRLYVPRSGNPGFRSRLCTSCRSVRR